MLFQGNDYTDKISFTTELLISGIYFPVKLYTALKYTAESIQL